MNGYSIFVIQLLMCRSSAPFMYSRLLKRKNIVLRTSIVDRRLRDKKEKIMPKTSKENRIF